MPELTRPQRRALTLLALVLLGVAIGGLLAWWQRAGDVAKPEPSAAVGHAEAATPTAFAQRPSFSVVPQMDAAELLRQPGAPNWRLARWRGNPQVLVLEFPDLAQQGAAMNRVAAFIEKAGAPRDRVLSNDDLARLIARNGDNAQTFYQGHDYVAEHLARFFSLARAQQQALNPAEQRLLDLLLEKRVLLAEGAGYTAQGLQAIVTFTQPQADDPRTPQDEAVDSRRRESVLLHELSHGLFFTNRPYREHCWRFWREGLSEAERAQWRRLLARMDYDPRNEELLVNEMQALLLHTPDDRAFNAQSLGLTPEQLERQRQRFRKGMPQQ